MLNSRTYYEHGVVCDRVGDSLCNPSKGAPGSEKPSGSPLAYDLS